MITSRSTICLTFDVDAISLWIGSFGATSPTAISRGEFVTVGLERLLGLLGRTGISGTFFVPDHTAETYPDTVRSIATEGHEIGHHGYLHESPSSLDSEHAEREVLDRGFDALARVVGVRPVGYRAP